MAYRFLCQCMKSSIALFVGTHLGVFDVPGRMGAGFFVLVVDPPLSPVFAAEPAVASEGVGMGVSRTEALDAEVVDGGCAWVLSVAHLDPKVSACGVGARVGASSAEPVEGVFMPSLAVTLLGSDTLSLGAGVGTFEVGTAGAS